MFSAAVAIISLLSAIDAVDVTNQLVWPVEDVTIEPVAEGLYGVRVPGFSSMGGSFVFLPEKTVMIPVRPDEEISVRVVPSGVRSLGAVPAIAVAGFDQNGIEVFSAADRALLQSDWGGLVQRGTFRRAGFVSVRLCPVTVQNGELLAAGSLTVELSRSGSSSPETVRSHEGEIFSSVFGTNAVWREPLLRTADSPFWGKPWARIRVDTAGVYSVGGELVPEAVGMPSASFSMITGRGRLMQEYSPFLDAFVPRQVPVYVDDGGDGTFDQSDRIIFYGRGLSWWGEFQSDHFNSRYDSLNTYWLTWGGEGGPFMDVLDGSLTGAPSAGTSYINRLHFEKNNTLANSFGMMNDLYAWHKIAASGSATANYAFNTPGTAGNGSLRFRFFVAQGGPLQFSATVNGVAMADTVSNSSGELLWEFPVTGLKNSGNSLAVRISNTSGSRDVFWVYTDWFEVFPETGFRSWSTMCQVPLDRNFAAGERRAVNWAQSLGDDSFVCVALSDTAVARIDIPGGRDFEIAMPDSWREPVMWVVPGDTFREPVSVSSASPGRIIETLSSGGTVYIYPDLYASDMPLFRRGRPDAVFVSLTEIYDEFNGGVRDPGAVRAFFTYTLKNWSTPPEQLVLVGNGHYDPRGFTTAKPSPMDVILYGMISGLPVCSDFLYTVTTTGEFPQAAVSRIAVDSRTELQRVAQRSAEYSDPSEESGTWQSVILGAADDERQPSNSDKDQVEHTEDAEYILANVVPERFIPLRNYLIFWDWNSNWKKPEAREAYLENWSEGALVSFYLGHGGFDQLADEGLLFIEDMDALACGARLPFAFFGSCEVGVFQNPSHACIAQKITVASGGGAIVASGASTVAYAGPNAAFLGSIMYHLLNEPQFSMGECQWLGIMDQGFSINNKPYIIFGDGSLHLALPDSGVTVVDPVLLTSELCSIDGSLNRDGLVMLTAWESAVVDSYYTRNSSYLIEYLSTPGVFYRGLAPASPAFQADMFVPAIAQTGDMGRVRYFATGPGGGDLACSYPLPVNPGQGSSGDTEGPTMEMWISGFRGAENPSVSGEVVFEAILEDSSGINLLPYPGVQLALYIDDSPVDVSEYFSYDPGSATSGRIYYPLPELQPGDHMLRLRAADNVTNISLKEITFHLMDSSTPVIDQFFVYPTPASTVMSFNWIQSSDGPVSISLYTIAGRRIIEFGNLPGRSGYNQHNWNLLDADGDKVASGTCIYVVSAGDSEISGVAAIVR